MTEIVFSLTDGEAKDCIAFVDRVAPAGDNIGEFSVLFKLIEQYEAQSPPDIEFVLTELEAQDVVKAFRHVIPNDGDGYPTVYYKLIEQFVPVPVEIITESGDEIVTEDGMFVLATEN